MCEMFVGLLCIGALLGAILAPFVWFGKQKQEREAAEMKERERQELLAAIRAGKGENPSDKT